MSDVSITLSPEVMKYIIGMYRREDVQESGRYRMPETEKEQRENLGYLCEVVGLCAKNLFPYRLFNPYAKSDANGISIRGAYWANSSLILRPKDVDNLDAILLTCNGLKRDEFPSFIEGPETFFMRGWINVGEGKKIGKYKDPLDHGRERNSPIWMVNQSQLHPFTEAEKKVFAENLNEGFLKNGRRDNSDFLATVDDLLK